ncbi:MAG: toprim domain-containing protein [Coprococcus comes]
MAVTHLSGKSRIHFDNDIAGRKAAQTLKTILPDKYEIVDEPPKAGKDFNDFLCMRMEFTIKKHTKGMKNDE